jgi:hypothetical protein
MLPVFCGIWAPVAWQKDTGAASQGVCEEAGYLQVKLCVCNCGNKAFADSYSFGANVKAESIVYAAQLLQTALPPALVLVAAVNRPAWEIPLTCGCTSTTDTSGLWEPPCALQHMS